MCKPDELELPEWLVRVAALAWRYRSNGGATLAVIAPISLAAVAGYLLLCPSDLDRARAAIRQADAAINGQIATADRLIEEMQGHAKRMREIDKLLSEHEGTTDVCWLEKRIAEREGHEKLRKAKSQRRDNLFRLSTAHRRLVVEAECELLRAEDARDAGSPPPVAPRVCAILAQVKPAN